MGPFESELPMGLRVVFFSLFLALAMAGHASAHPSYCQIEIVNDSHENVLVQVKHDDGSMVHFTIHAHDSAHYIDLFYYGYCHSSAHVTVTDPNHSLLYTGFSHTGSTIRIVPH